MSDEQVLTRNGCTLHYWLDGPATAPLVVLTHGATIDHTEWEPTLPVLIGAGFRVLTWDMPAHGRSRPGHFTMVDAEAGLLAILDALGVGQAIFLGHSLGGNLHQELVFHHPERVRALAMLDCTWNFQRLTASEKRLLTLAGPIFKLYPYRLLVSQSIAATTASPAGAALMRAAVERLSKDEITTIMLAATACLHEEPGYRIDKPLLLMVGDLDRTGNIRKAMPVWAKQEGCELVVFPGARHAPNFDTPDVFHSELLRFLQPLSSPARS